MTHAHAKFIEDEKTNVVAYRQKCKGKRELQKSMGKPCLCLRCSTKYAATNSSRLSSGRWWCRR